MTDLSVVESTGTTQPDINRLLSDPNTPMSERIRAVQMSSDAIAAPEFGDAPAPRETDVSGIASDPEQSVSDRIRAIGQMREGGSLTGNPTLTDLRSRDEFLASQVGQETLGQPGLDDFSLRADLALSDTFDEQHLKFMTRFPEGDFIFVPRIPPSVSSIGRGPTVLFRTSPEEQYAELDAMVLSRVEIIGDIADIAGEAPGIALETAAAIATRGASSAAQLAAMFSANVTGELLKEGVEQLRGYQLETVGTISRRAVIEAGIATATGGLSDLAVRGPLNFARGSAFIRLRPGAEAAQIAAAELGIDRLLPTQVANSPIIRKIGNQLAGTTQSVNDWVVGQHDQAVSALVRLRREDLARVLLDDPVALTELHEQAIDQIVPMMMRGEPTLSLGGTALGRGVVEYDELANTLVNQAYGVAKRIEAPTFDVISVKAMANDVLTGTRVQRLNDPEALMRADPIDPQLRDIAEQIKAADPTLPITMAGTPQQADAVAQLRAWRSQLWELKTPNPGEIFRQSHRNANRLFGAVDNALKNPSNADPGFLSAWTIANDLAHARFDTLEKLIITEVGKTETPARFAEKVIRPNSVDDLRILKEVVEMGPEGAARWEQFQASARGYFLDNGRIHRLNNVLDSYDRPTLSMMFNQEQIRDLRRIADQVEIIDQINMPGIAKRQSDATAAFQELVRSNNTRQIKEFVDLVGSLDPANPRRMDIRAGLMENIYNDVVSLEPGFSVVDAAKLQATMSELRRTRAIDLLTPDDIRVLENLDTVAPWLPNVADMGASLEAASVAAAGRGVPRAIALGEVETIWKFTGEMIELFGLGRMFTSPRFQRLVLGSGSGVEKMRQITSLRVFGAVTADVIRSSGVREDDDN